MNDLDEIRRLLPEREAPKPLVVAQARARMFTDVPTARPRLGLRFAVAATLGVAVAAGVLVLPKGQEATPPISSPSPSLDVSTGRGVLLLAAAQAAKTPATSGRYFRVRNLHLSSEQVGTGSGTYRVTSRYITESWSPADPAATGRMGSVSLGTMPSTPADTEAWRRDGSPKQWTKTFPDGGSSTIPSEPGEPTMGEWSRANPPLTPEEVASMPSDVDAVRALLLSKPVDPQAGEHTWLLRTVIDLLTGHPVPPAGRSALFKLLAGLDGIRDDGPATDPLGRTGTALTIPPSRDRVETTKLVVDTETGRLLDFSVTGVSTFGAEEPGPIHQVLLSAGWTDANPALPSPELR